MIDLSIIYVSDLKKLLPYKDRRSIIAFLTKYKVEIFGGKGCKRPYIFKIQFERALLQGKINFLIQKYGKDWLKVFQEEMKIHSIFKMMVEEKPLQQEIPTTVKTPKSIGTQGAKFLGDLHNI